MTAQGKRYTLGDSRSGYRFFGSIMGFMNPVLGNADLFGHGKEIDRDDIFYVITKEYL